MAMMTERILTALEILKEAEDSQRAVSRGMSSLQLLLGPEKAALAVEEAKTSVALAQLEYEEALQEAV